MRFQLAVSVKCGIIKVKKKSRGLVMKDKNKKYDVITHYLKTNGGSQVTLTFTQFDELLFPRSGLPNTARKTAEWWANDYKHSENGAYGWLNAGYEVVFINLEKEYVVFNKLVKSSWFINN
ncbi:hypothetical protein D920_00672 [Enterococcus faecalis 13-SD-W-01]|nr:hypothetical protein D920_00672 [Enterococcus faecalis 13-SD-W-01]